MLKKHFGNRYEIVINDKKQARPASVRMPHNRRFTGQAHLMEYFLLSLFILMLIFLLVLFLGSWQMTTTRSQQSEFLRQKNLFLLRAFSSTPLLNKEGENFMLEDSKLTVLRCDDLEEVYGSNWFAEVKSITITEPCDDSNYPICGYWSFCKKDIDSRGYDIPVNIYRRTTKEVDIGILTVGIYE